MLKFTKKIKLYKGRITVLFLTLLIFSACSAPSNLFIINEIGFQPPETKESMIYALPRTSLKVTVHYKKDVFIPGPYADYALKLLGIPGVQKQRFEQYSINSVDVQEIVEPDPERFYSVNVIEGSPDLSKLDFAVEKKLIITGDYSINTSMILPLQVSDQSNLLYTDVTMEPNVEMKSTTIYKTILTDTSFVKIPVTSEQMERKTIDKKAEEAAKLILEIRSDRYYIAAGLLDPFPDNYDMATSISSLDRLEQDYLSLFIGKEFTESFSKDYFVIPEGTLERENFQLDKFSKQHGIGDPEGENLFLHVEPEGNASSYRNRLPQQPESDAYNRFYYRLPEVCEVNVEYAEEILFIKRLHIFQSGVLVNTKIAEF
ncbi:DUF4831 family protein [Bacteroidota bacterium]